MWKDIILMYIKQIILFIFNIWTSIPIVGSLVQNVCSFVAKLLDSIYFRETSTPLGALFMKKYDIEGLSNLKGQVAIITGANRGMGFSTAKWLAKLDATVILACRNMEKVKAAKEALLDEIP